jgi:imidazolonepropionase-like amidohydrolase
MNGCISAADKDQPRLFVTIALVSANSLAAQALRITDSVGSIAAGMQADSIATDGNPLNDITAVRRVVFVMKAGKVYRNVH